MEAMTSDRRAEILAALRGLLDRVASLEPLACEGNADAVARVADDASALLQHTVTEMLALERLDQPPPVSAEDSSDPAAWWNELTPVYSPPRAADICFAAIFELRRVRHELDEARSVEDRLVAVEAGARKLRRSIRAVLAAARGRADSVPPDDGARTTLDSDLTSAIAVRRLYSGFRRALRRPEGQSSEAVLVALRYAAGALAMIVASPEYVALRASDRALLRRLRGRVLAWSRHVHEVSLGLQLLDDIWTAADLLRGINRRQELHAHDRRRIASLLGSTGSDARAWLAELETLFGLDDALDKLIDRARQEPSATMVEIRARLNELS
jgi:hypothetical protein